MVTPIRQPWADPVEDHFVTLRPQPSLRQAIICLKAAVEARQAYHAAGSPECDCERINNNEWRARADFFAACEREGIDRELVLILPEIV